MDVTRDVVIALRRLRLTPIFTIFSIVTLALGIGATTAIYSVIHATVFKPPAIRNIDEVVNLYHSDFTRGAAAGSFVTFSSADFEDLRKAQTSFSSIAAWSRFRHTLIGNNTTEVVMGELVGGDYFHVMGVEAALGRVILPADDEASAPPVMVLSDGVWRRHFGAQTSIIGSAVKMNGHQFVVIGVMPATFRGVDMPNVLPTAAWIPLSAAPLVNPARDPSDREARWLYAKARLKAGHLVAAAAAEVAAIGRQLDQAYPIGTTLDRRYRGSANTSRQWYVMPAADLYMHESVHKLAGSMATMVLLIVTLVLLVACTNLANLIQSRAASRRHELAVRVSLGASRWRLIREQLIESVVIAAAGALCALFVARLLMTALGGSFHVGPVVIMQLSPTFDPIVLALGGGATLLAFLVFGVVPAVTTTRVDLRGAIATDNAMSSAPQWRGRQRLIALQVAVSTALVAVAALCAQQLTNELRHDSGLDLDRLALVRLDFQMQAHDELRARQTLDTVLEGVRKQPNVEVAAIASGLPVGGTAANAYVRTASGRSQTRFLLLASTPDIFSTLGVEILRGRRFSEADGSNRRPVAVLSEWTARHVFGTADVIGRELFVQRQRRVGESEPPEEAVTIIGVAADTDTGSVGRRDSGVIYVPFAQHYLPRVVVVARTNDDPAGLVPTLQRLVREADRELAIFDSGTGHVLGGAVNLPLRVASGLTGALGVVALILAMVGLYGVLTHIVSARTREIGIRMSVGADVARVMRMVLLEGMRPIAAGLVIGGGLSVLTALFFDRMVARMLGLTIDPVMVAMVPLLFLSAGVLACYFPARRAARVDPNVALRQL